KPHSIWKELLLPVISEVLRTLLHISPTEIIRRIPLSNDTVQRRIGEMSNDTEETLCNFLRTTSFALQLDESTLRRNEILLLAYDRFLKDDRLTEELLFAKELVTDTKGESIYRAVEEFFKEKNIHLANIMSVATDGAPSMVGSQRTCLSRFYSLFATVLEFLGDDNARLRDNLKKFKNDIAYLT
ncbi:hypothetical protein M513_14202, partial [Trichuris suis]